MSLSPISNRSPDSELLAACSQGDEVAIDIFFNRFKDLIYYAINQWMSKSAQDEDRSSYVEEIFHDIFITLMEDAFAVLEQAHNPDKLSPLIYIIAYRATGDYFKKKWKRKKRYVEPPEGEGPVVSITDPVLSREMKRIIGEAIGSLEERERQIIELLFAEDLSYKQIAEYIGIKPNHVGVLIKRIKEKIKEYIIKHYPSLANDL